MERDLVSKYCSGAVRSQDNSKFLSLWWRDLSRVCEEGKGEGWFQKYVAWKVGSGDKVKFWEDA